MTFDFYLRHYRDLFEPLLALMLHGVRIDLDRLKRERVKVDARCIELQNELAEVCGFALHTKNDLSTAKVKKALYEWLGFPPITSRTTKAVTTEETAIHKHYNRASGQKPQPDSAALWRRDPDLAKRVCTLLLTHRKYAKLRMYLDPAKVDPDSRMRCQYKVTTNTGRLASSSNPKGTGLNLQNPPRDEKRVSIRELFVPDEGCIFLEVDLSQAEARMVYALTGDPELITLARSLPHEYDIHRANAAAIFKVPEADVTKTQRERGKMGVHAGHYGMRGKKLSEAALKDGLILDWREADRIILSYLAARPGILALQAATRKQLFAHRYIDTSWGRRLWFHYDRMNDETYRAGYARRPQSEIGDLLNQFGLIPVYCHIRTHNLRSRINLQVHDALVISCPLYEAYDLAHFLVTSLEKPRTYVSPVTNEPIELSIPAEASIGTTWRKSGLVGWKKFPSRKEFNETAKRLLNERPPV